MRVYRVYTTCTGEKDMESHSDQFIVLARLRSACLRCDQTLTNGTAEQQNTSPLPLPLTHARYTQEMTSCWVSLGSAAHSSHNLAAAIFARRRVRAHVKPTFTFIAALIPRRTKPGGDAEPLLNHPCNKTVRRE